MSRRFRASCALAAASAVVFALAGPALPGVAAPTAPEAAADRPAAPDTLLLTSAQLSVAVAKDFPRVVSYTDRASGSQLLGSTRPVTEIVLNGAAHPVGLKAAPVVGRGGTSASYTLLMTGLPGVEIDATLSVQGRATTFKVTAVRDTEAFRVGTIDIPGHDLVSVGSGEAGAGTAFTRLDPDSTRTADVFARITGSTPVDAAPVPASYGIVNTGALAAAVESNSTYDKPAGATGRDGARFWHRATKAEDGSVRVGVWSGQWTYRGDGAPKPESGEDLPWAKVVVTPDANADKTVDWQDGAIAFRMIGAKAPGSDETPDRVVTHIPFNFASQATHPFLRTLDDVKRISQATDGLGQLALLKGYGSEGHDSAHPDYGGNYNKRAGGLTDLNKLLKGGKQWGATFGVHINATESYPEAKAFSEQLVDKTKPGWNWLNQSYYIDQRRDVNSGDLQKRLKQLRTETDRNLSLLYIDVYYTHGWIAERTSKAVRDQGWNLATEWAEKFEDSSLWSHWANDLEYGGKTNKGLNSQIIRFIRNGEKDIWNDDPILGQTVLEDFEGWTGENDWNAFYQNIWQRNLPAKFLQQEKIQRWSKDRIDFTGGVRGTVENGKRAYYAGDAKVLDGANYLLPWEDNKKLYHYNKTGGTTTWTVPAAFRRAGSFTVSALGDNGRVKTATVPVKDGRVTLEATAGQPYVLYPVGRTPAARDAHWGEGGLVVDPGFNSARTQSSWRTTGKVARDTDTQGRNSAALTGTAAAGVSQRITGLAAGRRYTASAWIEVEPGKERRTVLSAGGEDVAVERSTAKEQTAANDWHGSYFQRAKVNFTAPASGSTTLNIQAAKGTSDVRVRVDDVRLVANAPAVKPGTLVYEDFEAVDQGWGPFFKGDAGGDTDPRTHLAQKNAPYTQAGWNGKRIDDVLGGKESLKSHEENDGVVYRTGPWSVPMKDGRQYRVEFDQQSSHAGAYEWVTGYDRVGADSKPSSVETRRTPLAEQRTTAHFAETVTAGCGDTWVGLRKRADAPEGADFVLDGFTVTDLGPAPEKAACGTLAVAATGTVLEPGQKNEVKATFTNNEAVAATDVTLSLGLPEGWQAEPAGPVRHASVAPGAKAVGTWQVTPPSDAKYQTYTLTSKAAYAVDGASRTLSASAGVRTLTPPPTADVYASDHDWISAENGWGPAEKDMDNGETAPGDGTPLKINGKVYEKGLGTASPGRIRYYLGGKCTSFTAEVGVDDSQAVRGSVTFAVAADGTEAAKSPVLKAPDAAWPLTADVTGATYVDLVTGDAGDGPGNDHAAWANARFHCGS